MTDDVPWGYAQPAARFHIEQSWWICSELVRRHPSHVVYEMHPGGGLGDELAVVPAHRLREGDARIRINRGGTIRVDFHHEDNSFDELAVGHSASLLAAEGPHDVVKRLEISARLPAIAKAPATTPRSVAFRFVSTALTMNLNDRHHWDCRNAFRDSSGYDTGPLDYLKSFPAAVEDARAVELSPWDWGNREAHFWALLRSSVPVALVSAEGRFYLGDGSVDLLKEYIGHNRRMPGMVADLLMDRL